MSWSSRLSRHERSLAWVCLLLGTLWMGIGCSPSMLGFLLAPWIDDKIPAKCKLSTKDKENNVVVLCNFASPNTRLDLIRADEQLAERFVHVLTKMLKDNKEKVKFVPLAQVRSYQNKMTASGVVSDREIGKHFNADLVLVIDINTMDLHEFRSSQLYRGQANLNVRVIDMNTPAGEGEFFPDTGYTTQYPRTGPEDAGNCNVMQFRAKFLTHVAADLARWFAAYPSDEKYRMD